MIIFEMQVELSGRMLDEGWNYSLCAVKALSGDERRPFSKCITLGKIIDYHNNNNNNITLVQKSYQELESLYQHTEDWIR